MLLLPLLLLLLILLPQLFNLFLSVAADYFLVLMFREQHVYCRRMSETSKLELLQPGNFGNCLLRLSQ